MRTEEIVGAIAALLVAIVTIKVAIPQGEQLSKEILPPKIEHARNDTTLNDIIEVLKGRAVDQQTLDTMMYIAGVDGLPEPPEGWRYVHTDEGVRLTKRK